jgi:hypothetical protein
MCLLDWPHLAQRQLHGELVLRPPRCWSRRRHGCVAGRRSARIDVASLGSFRAL